ncbi:hypothetical protein [Formosa sp. PL04]|uniref:hypothetical protein n=1 Tax=Formosa sp. PL04 TaxID=3081755 RepID=UPI00298247A0|nr:hypothetical protein [Formosa sp. PL04]MDW5290835.1 hypothetical protein [Formosa sp. PL04]
MKEKLSKIVIGMLFFFIAGVILIWLDIINLSSFFGHIVGYLLPFVLALNAVNIFLFAKSKEYNILEKLVLGTLSFCIIACLIYLVSISLGIANPIYSYVFIYIVFPYIFLIFFGYIFFLIKERQFSKSNFFSKMIFLLIILIGILFINLLF